MLAGFPTDDGVYESGMRRHPAMATLLNHKRPNSPRQDPAMTDLKTRVQEHGYAVDSSLVAEEILRKLRMVKWARHALASEPDRTPQPKLRGL